MYCPLNINTCLISVGFPCVRLSTITSTLEEFNVFANFVNFIFCVEIVISKKTQGLQVFVRGLGAVRLGVGTHVHLVFFTFRIKKET